MKLLAISTSPLAPPTDRDMLPSERREFVRTHRTCVFGFARQADGPAMSIVYYIPTDTDELLVSTMRDRGKAKAIGRSGKVSLCVLDEKWPTTYLQVYCDAVVDTDLELVVDTMLAVGGRMSGEPLGEDARPFVEAMAKEEGRVVLRCTPYETFATPPRHLDANDQEEKLTHWASGAIPWDAED
jgi:hypothetical protein